MSLASSLRELPALGFAPSLPRRVDYLRLSVTDRCNERCLYCLPENFSAWTPRADILTDIEILALVGAAVGMGFRHFRVTGGEPLLRPGIVDLIGAIHDITGVETVQITTNATRLSALASDLYAAGLRRINISLDAVDSEIYHHITRGELKPVLEGIRAARAAGFTRMKLNTVLMRGKNEGQIGPLIRFAAEHEMPIRFIELMPVSLTEMLDESNFLPVGEVFRSLSAQEELIPVESTVTALGLGPAKYYRMTKTGATVGFIGALTDLHFCENCNKVRVTADGKLRPCLGAHGEYDLKRALRPEISDTDLRQIFAQALAEKPPQHLFRDNYQPGRVMTAIGG